jgi:hypothetical protein
VRVRIREYFEFVWDHGLAPYHKELIARVPPMLAAQAELATKKKLVMRVPLFARCSPSTVLQLVGALHPRVAIPDEFVMLQVRITQGEPGSLAAL